MASYRLTETADRDFENIFDFGIDTFGLDRATVYQTEMLGRFAELATQPMLYNAVDHIQEGYRRSIFGPHSIYYRIEQHEVVIVRILGRQNPGKAFGGQE